MAAQKRNPAERDKDRAEVMELYLQGRTQASIAATLGVSQQQISHDLAAIRRAWVKEAVRDFDELKSRELAKIDNLEVTYWQAWTDSQRDIESEVEQLRGGKLVKGENGEPGKIQPASVDKTKRTQERSGDPRFLQGVQWCIEKRCKILGLDAPTKTQSIEIDFSEFNADELDRLIAGEDALRVIADSRARRKSEGATGKGVIAEAGIVTPL